MCSGKGRRPLFRPASRLRVWVVFLVLTACSHREEAAPPGIPVPAGTSPRAMEPVWAVNPADPGPDLPPVGRSLFDFVIAESGGRVPFPFSKLVDEIARLAGQAPRRVLIPLNRSLQRHAAAGRPFDDPRAVLGVDGESPDAKRYLKDRLFVAYHARARILEVISYNEAAGRFEFQVVREYPPLSALGGEGAEGGGPAPAPRYASRILCTTCHQNQAPIFSRPLWRETNANPEVAARLSATGRAFYGFPVTQGVDVPNALDASTDRANDLAVALKFWREEGGNPSSPAEAQGVARLHHRSDLLKWVLQYRLGRLRLEDLVAPPDLVAAWQEAWPTGLAVPSADIPDRDPLRHERMTFGVLRPDLRAPFEPSLPREAGEVWQVPRDADAILRRVVGGLATFFSEADIRRLEGVDAAAIEAAIGRIRDRSRRGTSDALSAKPFRRAAIMQALEAELPAELQIAPAARCCLEETGLPAAQPDVVPHAVKWPADADPALPLFERYCAGCHHGSGVSPESHPSQGSHPFPPDFLHGGSDRVEANVKQCAERIFFRLSMWDAPLRLEAPMPPFYALQRKGLLPAQWVGHDDLKTLRRYVSRILESESGKAPKMEDFIERGYDNLRRCIPS